MNSIAGSTKAIKSRRGFAIRLWAATLLVNLFVIGMVALAIEHNRKHTVAQAGVLTRNYSQILKEDLAGFISKIDIVLLTVRDEVVRQMARGGINQKELEAFLARQDTYIPETLGLRVADAQGIVRYAVNDVQVSNVSIADRPQFIRLRDDPEAGLVISRPIMGRAAKKWMITLGRRINNPDGSFAGNVHVAVGVEHFIALFSRIDLGAKGNIGLWNETSLIARYTRTDAHGASTGSASPSPELRALLGSGRKAVSYHGRTGIDGVPREFFFDRVGNYPLYLVVGLADEDYLAEWKREAVLIGGVGGLFAIVSLLSSGLLYRSWRRREIDREKLFRQEAQYTAKLERSNQQAEAARRQSELILSSAGEGICGVDPEGNTMFINPAARKMFGWSEDEGVGLNLHTLTHHHRMDGGPYPFADCAVHQTLQDGKARQIHEDVYWRKDGTSFPVEFTVAPMEQDGRISGAVNVFRDITERKQLEQRITRMALFDELTGLPNRSFLSDALLRMAAVSQRRQESMGVLYVDLDGFKSINDTMGHAAGDTVLREVAARLRACIRTEDVAARLGGDEFLVVTLTGNESAQENCINLANRIIEALHQPFSLPEGTARISASVGIAIFPRCGAIERCIRQADAAMYQAKNSGKDRYAMADD